MNVTDELKQIDRRLAELRKQSHPQDAFDWDDVEYLRLLSRKIKLGLPERHNGDWFGEMAEKLVKTLDALEGLQHQWGERVAAAKQDALQEWLETTFREAIGDDDRVLAAAGLMKVGVEAGDGPVEVLRRCIASFVIDLIKPGVLDVDSNPANPGGSS